MTKQMIIRLIIGIVLGGGLGAMMGYFGKCSSGTCPLTANPFRGAMYGAVIGLLFAYTSRMHASGAGRASAGTVTGEIAALVHVNSKADFDKVVLESDLPVLADFYSDSCPPCRRLSPTITELAEEYRGRAVVCKVSLDQARELAQPHGIRGIPAVLFFVDGREVDRLVGLRGKKSYAKVLDKLTANQSRETEENAAL